MPEGDFISYYDSPLGRIMMAADEGGLFGLWFRDQKHYGANLSADHAEGNLPVFAETLRWLDCYFHGSDPGFTPALNLRTTAFRTETAGILLTIPYGETRTYGEVAELLAKRAGLSRMSAQAVGGAIAHNPVSLIIPCHRVIARDGSLRGYAGGLWRKEKLLDLEQTGKRKQMTSSVL